MKKRGFSLIIAIIIAIIAIGVVVIREDKIEDKIEDKAVIIPEKCQDFKDDVCGLFACTVDICWCDEASSSSPVLAETGNQITKEEDAVKAVSDYLESIKSEYVYDIRAVEINDLFYNVFAYNEDKNEKVLSISFDGKILKTTCGI